MQGLGFRSAREVSVLRGGRFFFLMREVKGSWHFYASKKKNCMPNTATVWAEHRS